MPCCIRFTIFSLYHSKLWWLYTTALEPISPRARSNDHSRLAEPRRSPPARRLAVGPEPCRSLCFVFWRGKSLKKEWSGRARGNANPQRSRCCSFVRSVACPVARRFTPRHPPRGCFRYGYERLDSFVPPYPRTPSPPVGSSGRLLFGERKESSPQLGFILVPSDSTLRTTPLLVFISVVGSVASASLPPDLDEGRRSSFAIGRS